MPILLHSALGLSADAGRFSAAATLVCGAILAGTALTAAGSLHPRRALTAVGVAFLFAVSIPLLVDGSFVFALLPAAVSLLPLSGSRPAQRAYEAD